MQSHSLRNFKRHLRKQDIFCLTNAGRNTFWNCHRQWLVVRESCLTFQTRYWLMHWGAGAQSPERNWNEHWLVPSFFSLQEKMETGILQSAKPVQTSQETSVDLPCIIWPGWGVRGRLRCGVALPGRAAAEGASNRANVRSLMETAARLGVPRNRATWLLRSWTRSVHARPRNGVWVRGFYIRRLLDFKKTPFNKKCYKLKNNKKQIIGWLMVLF